MADAVFKQTTKVLEKKNISMPDIKLTGSYDVSVKLHPQVRLTRLARLLGHMMLIALPRRSLPSSSSLWRSSRRFFAYILRVVAALMQAPSLRLASLSCAHQGAAGCVLSQNGVQLVHAKMSRLPRNDAHGKQD